MNKQIVAECMNAAQPAIAKYAVDHLKEVYGNKWKLMGIQTCIYGSFLEQIPLDGSDGEIQAALPVETCIILNNKNWADVFSRYISYPTRTVMTELRTTCIQMRNLKKKEDLSDHDALRGIDTLRMVLHDIGAPEEKTIETMENEYAKQLAEKLVQGNVKKEEMPEPKEVNKAGFFSFFLHHFNAGNRSQQPTLNS